MALLAAISFDVGTVLTGLAAIIVAVTGFMSLRRSRRAETKADKALEASPMALFTGLKTEVQAVIDTYHESAERWAAERSGIGAALDRERARADAAEAVVLILRGEIATMKIDLVSARAEVADLRARFESAIGRTAT